MSVEAFSWLQQQLEETVSDSGDAFNDPPCPAFAVTDWGEHLQHSLQGCTVLLHSLVLVLYQMVMLPDRTLSQKCWYENQYRSITCTKLSTIVWGDYYPCVWQFEFFLGKAPPSHHCSVMAAMLVPSNAPIVCLLCSLPCLQQLIWGK